MSTYLTLLRRPGVARLIASASPGRLAYNMIGLATFFYVHDTTGSLTLAGLATGAETMASSLTAGFRGQFIDKYGQTRPLSIFVPSWVAFLALLTTQHSHAGIITLSALVGISSPPINLSARPLWRAAVGAENLRTAYALDTTMMNVAQIVGPFIATTLALSISAQFALLITAGLMLVGGTAMVSMPLSRSWVPEPQDDKAPSLLRNHPYRLLAIEGIIFGAGWGLLEITIPAMSTQMGLAAWSAPLLASYAAMAVVGGIAVGGGRFTATPLQGFRIAQVCVTAAALPLAATSPGISMALVLAMLGLSTGFAQVYHWEVVEAVRPRGTATTAQAWLWTMEGSAIALGSAAGGYIVEHVNARVSLGGVSLAFASATAFIWLYASRHLTAADRPLTDDEVAEAIADLEPTIE